jgi:acyl carrier protein
MDTNQLKVEVRALVSAVIEVDEFGDEENFVNELGVDSMMALEIVARIERSFRIRVPESYLSRFQTLTGVVGVVQEILTTAGN